MATFRFRKCCAHLTYRTHLNHEQFLAWFIDKFGELKYWSFVHEDGHENEETNYSHTHFFWRSVKRLERTDPRCFDFGGIHPHIQLIKDGRHERAIFDDYHKKAPLFLAQSPNGPTKSGFDIDAIRSAETLADACDVAGIVPRSVSDILLLRADKPSEPFEHRYPGASWSLDCGSFRALVLHGPTNTGKTQCALHQFDNPLLVRHLDKLREFRAGFHDGIVFDDMSFGHMPRTSVIHLLDWELESSIHCRYACAIIPKETKKIFTTNQTPAEMFGYDDGAIRRRYRSIHVVGPTYGVPGGGDNINPAPQLDVLPDFDFDLSCFDEL